MSGEIPLPILLGGPSGSGKSTLGQYLESQGWLHLEADRSGSNGIDDLELHEVWNSFNKQYDPGPLAQELEQKRVTVGRARVILTLPSTPLSAAHLECASGVLLIRFLSGPAEACKRGYTERELAKMAIPSEAHWIEHNTCIFKAFDDPAYAPYKLAAFQEDGCSRVAKEILARRLFELSGPLCHQPKLSGSSTEAKPSPCWGYQKVPKFLLPDLTSQRAGHCER